MKLSLFLIVQPQRVASGVVPRRRDIEEKKKWKRPGAWLGRNIGSRLQFEGGWVAEQLLVRAFAERHAPAEVPDVDPVL
ncbi:hypothetical protein [Thioclava sediminum]|uniref:hypothetical protein n=1 Tax=Thioclava sediminum TaxID=1915319 RepID=UPI0011BAD2F5|nr:hypothetical protein [Thioclava sediminum]